VNAYSINKIIVPVDLSEPSLNALETAVALATRHSASLSILNVIENRFDSANEDRGAWPDTRLSGSSDVLTAVSGSIYNQHGLRPELIQENGNVADTIVRLSYLEQCDLIVMGTHGASGFRDGYIGSNTYNVIKQSACPVLSVPSRRKFVSFRKILFPIRPVTGALSRYDVLSQLLQPSATIDVLGLSLRKSDNETSVLNKIISEISGQLDKDQVRAITAWGNGNTISDQILDYAQMNHTDLIAITSGLDVTTKPNFIGPHAQRIINCAKVPVISIKKIGSAVLA
jgi:nucleotide-binding universal stress UspA family protein